ncbi:MAG: phage tail protein [Burkholderiales bacterium]
MDDDFALGTLLLFAGTFVPKGYLACNGQAVNISSNSTLWQLIGTAFGGDGTTTFALPNLPPVAAGNGVQLNWAMCVDGAWPDNGVYAITGQVRPFPFPVLASTTLADSWLPCDGRTLPINNANEVLFFLLGNTYGGDGTTTFALPNLAPLVPAAGTNIPWYICVNGIFPNNTCSTANPGLGLGPYDFLLASVCHFAIAPATVKKLCDFADCNGQKLTLVNSPWDALYSLLGTTYGPIANNEFALPTIPTGSNPITPLLCINGLYPERS